MKLYKKVTYILIFSLIMSIAHTNLASAAKNTMYFPIKKISIDVGSTYTVDLYSNKKKS